MVAPVKFDSYTDQLNRGKHAWDTHVFKWMLTNSAPSAANTIKSNITEIAAGNGYIAGGVAIAPALTSSGGVSTIKAPMVTITAAGGSIGPFRYAVLYNDTQTTPAKPLVQYVDYGSAVTLAAGESLDIQFTVADTVSTLT